jgi:integrase
MKLSKPQKLKSGMYVIRLRLNGKAIAVYGETEAECRRNATAIKADHLTGRVIVGKCNVTVTEAIDNYISKRPKLSPSTVRGYRSIQKNVFTPVMNQKLDEVDWQRAIDKDDHAPKTIHNAWGFIASVIAENGLSVPKVRLPAKISNERAFLQPNQIPTFLEAIKGAECELAALLGLHSLRRSEILDVTYGDIDFKNNIIHVRGAAVMNDENELVHKKTNKNETSRRDVPIMIPRLIELVQTEPHSKTDYLVTLNPNNIWRGVNTICRKNNLPEIGCHGLRHSFVSLAYHLGWSEISTMKVAGYADYQTMRKIYTHLADEDKQKDIKNMKSFFDTFTL